MTAVDVERLRRAIRDLHGVEGGRRYVAVLGVPPIKSAQDAVRASIAADTRRR